MKRYYYLILLSFLGSIQILCAQASAQSVQMRKGYELLPQEGVFIHQNNNLLFSGERLYYKIYCLDIESRELSELSKIAYVGLIDKDQNFVFRHKIRLEDGTGSGDFAIPAEVATGTYKLIGYTRWMQSRTEQTYFESDLIIINPYKVTPQSHQIERVSDSTAVDSIAVIAVPEPVRQILSPQPMIGENILSLSLDQDRISPRSRIDLEVEAFKPDGLNGSYSLTVRKIDDSLPQIHSAIPDMWSEFKKSTRPRAGKLVDMPELRGELISGKVLDKESDETVPAKQVVLSLPGDHYILDIAQTDQNGSFYFNLDTEIETSQAVLQLLGDDREDYSIMIDEHHSPEFDEMEFPSFTLDKVLEDKILGRSIHNQIENSYAIVKSDSIKTAVEDVPFYRNYQQRFFLDDYTRFNTLRETMVEIIDNGWIDENDGDPSFGVRPFDGYLDVGSLEPIVMVDGLFIQDHKDVVDYNSKEVRRISISRDRFMVGPKIYQGLIALETKAGDFYDVFYRGFLVNTTLARPEAQRAYYFQKHEDPNQTRRIPDYRYQLLWEPNLKLDQTKSKVVFYTSDISGEFEVELQGYTNSGVPISLRKRFTVE